MKKILTLETLDAKHGDSLILQYGPAERPNVIVIDGGPPGVYRRTLRERLLELKDAIDPRSPLMIKLLMISHIDDDHIKGVIDLLEELKQEVEDARVPSMKVEHMWYNTFDDIIGNIELPRISNSSTAAVANVLNNNVVLKDLPHDEKAVIASTNQGRTLDQLNRFFRIPKNEGEELLTGLQHIRFEDRFTITVLHPNLERLEELQTRWDRDLKKAKDRGDDSIIYASLSSRDTSPFNLASIVCLVKYKSKRILLTGDARSDDIMAALEKAGLFRRGLCYVDILKIPHHGSDRNLSVEFFQKVRAKHYIFSADGRHHNPDKASLMMLLEGTKRRNKFTVYFTNGTGKEDLEGTIEHFRAERKRKRRKFGIEILDEASGSFKVDLLEPAVL